MRELISLIYLIGIVNTAVFSTLVATGDEVRFRVIELQVERELRADFVLIVGIS